MKNFRVVLLVLLGFVGTFAVHAQKAHFVNIDAVPLEKKVSVVFSEGMRDGTINIYDQAGSIVWSENLEVSDLKGKVFDLKSLPNGDYEIVVSAENKELVQPFSIGFNSIALDATAKKAFFTPSFKVVDNKVDLTFLNSKIGNVDVSIIDASGNIVYEEAHKNILQLQKRYQLSNLNDGSYTMVVKTPQKAYYQRITLD